MHKKINPNRRRNQVLLIAASALSVIVVAALVIIFTRNVPRVQVQSVVQPASASQVAQSFHCTKFKDQHNPDAVLSDDSGSCYIGGSKYAINTFPDQASRDRWLQSAVQLGVRPRWKTPTAVVYPSVE